MADYGRDLEIGMPRDEAKNVRVSIDEVIGVSLKQYVTDVLDESNEELRKIKEASGIAIGVDLDSEVK
jgi:hypothetical protein